MTSLRLASRLVLPSALVLLGMGLALLALAGGARQRQLDRGLEARARALLEPAARDGKTGFGAAPGLYFQVWRDNGAIVARSASLGVAAQLERWPAAATEDMGARFRDVELPGGGRGRQAQVDVPPFTVAAAVARHEVDAGARPFYAAVGAVLLLFLAALGGVGHAVTVRELRPFARLAATVEELEEDAPGPSRALPERLDPLLARVHELLGRADRAAERERRLSADVAHELRTPVAELRSLAEVARRVLEDRESVAEFVADVGAIARQMGKAIDDLETLARSESGLEPMAIRPVALCEILERVWPTIAERGRERGLACRLDAAPEILGDTLTVETDPDKLQLILLNLLVNAVTYSRAGGEVRLTARPENGRLRLEVANPPRDLDEADLPHLFDRFWRKDASRSGNNAGLGLALARALAERLGVEIETRLAEGVLSVTLLVPLVAPSSSAAKNRPAAQHETPTKPALALAAVLLWSLYGGAVQAADDWAGLSLEAALRRLGDAGLEVFFTSQLVRPEMRVETEPAATTPRAVLDQLLAPHGLSFEEGPGGRLVIVAATGPAGIRGVIRARTSGAPVAGVRLRVDDAFASSTSGPDGYFELVGVPPGLHTLEAHRPGFVIERLAGVRVFPHRLSEVDFELEASPLTLDEILVTPSRISLLRDEPVTALDLDRDEVLSLPHLGDDVFRALTLLPGVAGEEVSARFHVRGGRDDEVLVLLDRVELFEPFHLRDFSSAISIVAPRALREVNLITGGFPAEYGDRMSGVLDMSTARPATRQFQLGFGIPNVELGGSGTFAQERGHALGTVRRGTLELALDALGQEENPAYWDAFAKLEYQPRPAHRFGVQGLHSEDDLDFIVNDPDADETYVTFYSNSYVWLTHQSIFHDRLYVDSTFSVGRVERDRRGIEILIDEENGVAEGGFEIRDERRLDVVGLKQDWNGRAGERHELKWGFDVRDFEAFYDYQNLRQLDDPLADVRSEPRSGTTEFEDLLEGEQYSFYLSDRFRPSAKWILELGLRWDEHTLTDDRNLSPRLNAVFSPGPSSLWRFAWGHFYQSQRPYELQVADGEATLARAERTEQRVIGYERSFVTGHPLFADLLWRVEVYQRLIDHPRTRFVNLFEPVSSFPEIEPDRYRVAPRRARARGLEIFLRGRLGPRIDWWAGYALSRIEDLVDERRDLENGNGPRWVPRRVDQTHALSLDFNFHAGEHWDLNLAWRYHTGWPTTAISGRLEVDDEGETEIVPVLGPVHAERLPDYHRLDLRASREWRTRRGGLTFFVEIQNLYDRGNVAGFDVDFEFELDENGDVVLDPLEEIWGGFLPSFGITWEF